MHRAPGIPCALYSIEGHCPAKLGRNPRRGTAEARPHDALLNLNDARRDQCCAKWHYPSNTASAPFTASALSVTVFSSEAACTEMFSAKNLASVI